MNLGLWGATCGNSAREEYAVKEDIMVPMRDGVLLAGDLYFPTVNNSLPPYRFPVVLIRTPYNKALTNPDLRHPGLFWAKNGFLCFIQDCRGRFKSKGEFYKYTGEAQDGYDTVEWLAKQPWCNGSIVTDGPSYLCHVQTSMALLRPPHLKAMFCNKGGFYNAHTSGVRNGGAYEARQWVWGLKNASRKDPVVKKALNRMTDMAAWFMRMPFKRGDSPVSVSPEYERFLFDQFENSDYNDYWKQIGLNTEEHLDAMADIPAVYYSGWYDIYCRSTVDFFVNLHPKKKGPVLLVMGPWIHTGGDGHVAGEVDFGVQSVLDEHNQLVLRWFSRWVDPKGPAEFFEKDELGRNKAHLLQRGPSPPLPPPVRYFRMGGGDGHKTINGHMFHGGEWATADTFPPRGVEIMEVMLARGSLVLPEHIMAKKHHEQQQAGGWSTSVEMDPSHEASRAKHKQPISRRPSMCFPSSQEGQVHAVNRPLSPSIPTSPVASPRSLNSSQLQPQSQDQSHDLVTQGQSGERYVKHLPSVASKWRHGKEGVMPPPEMLYEMDSVSKYQYDPRNPCPSIGGNLFPYQKVLLAGAFNQFEREDMFLCRPPLMPLSSRRDVLVFRTPPLTKDIDVTGQPSVVLYASSSALDTDFTVKLVDEYPPSVDYPLGFAMNITHGILRCRYRNSREHAELMEPGKVYELKIDMYPTSNLFQKGHRLRLDISSSNFPHFDLNFNTGEAPGHSQRVVVADQCVFHQPELFPSRILLPVLGQSPQLPRGLRKRSNSFDLDLFYDESSPQSIALAAAVKAAHDALSPPSPTTPDSKSPESTSPISPTEEKDEPSHLPSIAASDSKEQKHRPVPIMHLPLHGAHGHEHENEHERHAPEVAPPTVNQSLHAILTSLTPTPRRLSLARQASSHATSSISALPNPLPDTVSSINTVMPSDPVVINDHLQRLRISDMSTLNQHHEPYGAVFLDTPRVNDRVLLPTPRFVGHPLHIPDQHSQDGDAHASSSHSNPSATGFVPHTPSRQYSSLGGSTFL